jgi:DNA-binding NarL/FixJ family response regulator
MARRILLVDDNPNVRSALNMIFRGSRDWVVCGEAANGREAVELTHKLNPNAILLDFQMPEMDGLEAAKEILKEKPSLPIVLYSLHGTLMLEKPAKAIGIAKVISKTAIFSALLACLDDVLPAAASSNLVDESVHR